MATKRNLAIAALTFLFVILTCSCEKDRPIKFHLNYSTFTDERDGNEYKTVTINGTTWFAENFRYLPSVDGNDVDSVSFDGPRYYVYNYNGTNVNEAKATDEYKKYGVLYNYNAAIECCPDGWRLPTKDDFEKLTMSINNDKKDKWGNFEYYTILMLCGDRDLWGLDDSTHTLFNVSGMTMIPSGIMRPEYPYNEYTGEGKDSIEFKDLGISSFIWEKKRGREKDYLSALQIEHDTTATQIDFRMHEWVSSMPEICGLSVRYVRDE